MPNDVTTGLIRNNFDFAVDALKQVIFDRGERITKRLVTRADTNRLKAVGVAFGTIGEMIAIDLVEVGIVVVTPYGDGHARMILAGEKIVVDAVRLTVDRHPKVAGVDATRVVIDDRRVGES